MIEPRNEIQEVIDEYCAGSENTSPMVKKSLRIERFIRSTQHWSVDVLVPKDKAMWPEIINAIQCEGVDWGKMTDEEVTYCDDEMTIKNG